MCEWCGSKSHAKVTKSLRLSHCVGEWNVFPVLAMRLIIHEESLCTSSCCCKAMSQDYFHSSAPSAHSVESMTFHNGLSQWQPSKGESSQMKWKYLLPPLLLLLSPSLFLYFSLLALLSKSTYHGQSIDLKTSCVTR